jgi:hypothetical protein
MPNEGGEFECGNHSIQYDDYDFIFKSLRDDGVYVKLPIEDYDSREDFLYGTQSRSFWIEHGVEKGNGPSLNVSPSERNGGELISLNV